MSIKELDRFEMIKHIIEKRLTQSQAAEALCISVRQVKRLVKRFKADGIKGLISKKKGCKSNHALPEGLKNLVKVTIEKHYGDFGPTLAQEKLYEIHALNMSVSTVRSIMVENEIWVPRKVKKKRVFQFRERRRRKGELGQIDGSPHAWFEDRGEQSSLMYIVDDATGEIMAGKFCPTETTEGYFDVVKEYVKTHGRPQALYSDKHAVFKINRTGALSGDGITQFGRAMKELDIEMIFANSPQAKGRIERMNQTLQDRLVKELRLQNISTLDAANAFLPTFFQDFNRRFAVIPKNPNNAHRELLQEHNLDRIFTTKEYRSLSKNLTFQHNNTIYQVQTSRQSYALKNAKIEIYEKKDGSIEAFYKGAKLLLTTYSVQEKQRSDVDAKQLNAIMDALVKNDEKKKRRPSKRHPWKRHIRKFSKTLTPDR